MEDKEERVSRSRGLKFKFIMFLIMIIAAMSAYLVYDLKNPSLQLLARQPWKK